VTAVVPLCPCAGIVHSIGLILMYSVFFYPYCAFRLVPLSDIVFAYSVSVHSVVFCQHSTTALPPTVGGRNDSVTTVQQ